MATTIILRNDTVNDITLESLGGITVIKNSGTFQVTPGFLSEGELQSIYSDEIKALVDAGTLTMNVNGSDVTASEAADWMDSASYEESWLDPVLANGNSAYGRSMNLYDDAGGSNIALQVNVSTKQHIIGSSATPYSQILNGYGSIVNPLSSNSDAFKITQNNTGSYRSMLIDHYGNFPGLQINDYGPGQPSLNVFKDNTGDSAALFTSSVNADGDVMRIAMKQGAGASNVRGIYIDSDAAGTGPRAIEILSTDNGNSGYGINMNFGSEGRALRINASNAGSAFAIDSSSNATSTPGSKGVHYLQLNSTGVVNNLYVENLNSSGTGAVARFQNLGAGITGYFRNNNTTSTAALIYMNHTGLGAGMEVNLGNVSNSSNAVTINNSGAGYDVRGTGSSWFINSNGNATFASLTIKKFSQSAAPTTGDMASGEAAFWHDTDTSQLYLLHNDGGTIKGVELTSV